MSALGSLVVKIALEHAEFTKGLDKSSQEALRFAKNSQDSFDKFSRSTTAAFANVAKSAGAAVAAFASVSAVINQISGSIRFADEINDIAKANEVAVGTILKLSQALSLNGGSAADASKFFSSLTASIDQAAQGSEETQKRFASLGVSLEDLRTLDGQQIFEQTLKGLQDIEDPIKRNAAAMDLFDKAAKGVDIAGLASDYSSNQGNFDDAEESFKAIGDAMDRLDSFTFKTSQTLAETFGPALLSIITVVDDLVFGFDKLERNINKTANANAKFKSAPRIGDAPVAGAFNLPPEFQAQSPEIRQVIDKAAQKAQQEAERAAQKARDAAIEAKRKAAEEAKNLDLQESVYRANLEKDYQKQLRDNFEKRKKDEAEAEKEAYELKLKNLDLLQQKANDNFEEAQRQAREVAEEAQRAADELNRSLTDALLRGFESGKDFARNFRDTLVNLFQTLVLRPIINFVLNQSGITGLLGGIGSLFSGSAVAGESGGGITGLFSSVKDIFTSTNNSIVSSIESLGTFLSDGPFKSLGGMIGQYAGEISNILPFAGAAFNLLQGNIAGAIGSGLGAALSFTPLGPLGGVIGSVLGSALGGLFGGRPRTQRFSTGATGTLSNGAFSSNQLSGIAGYGRQLGGGDALSQAMEQYSRLVNEFFSAFGMGGDVNTQSSLFQRSGRRTRAWGYFSAQAGGGSANISQPAPLGSAQDALNDLVNRIFTQGITQIIQTSNIGAGVKKFFDQLTSREEILDAVQTLASFNKQLETLPPIFNAIRNAIDTTVYDTSIAQLKAQFQATQTFVDLFYSDAEKFGIFSDQLNSQFTKLNQAIPTSRDQYRALVESINVVDEASRDQFNGLIALAPAMNEYFNLLSQQADGINEVNQALADGLNQNLFSTFADYASARASVANGMTATGFMGDLSVRRSQGDAELASAVKSLVAQQARTDVILAEIADATRRTREINERWNGDGLPETRVI